MKKLFSIAALSAAVIATPAFAMPVTFEFDGATGAGGFIDGPTNAGNITTDCGTQGLDACTIDFGEGFDYAKDGIAFNAQARSGGAVNGDQFETGEADRLIQDLVGPNQGLGVISGTEGAVIGSSADQINFETGESIFFSFASQVRLLDIFVNDGLGNDCPGGGSEGPCGDIGIIVDGGAIQTFTDFLAMGVIASGGVALELVGTTFEFISLTQGAGYSIEAITVVPVPGAIPLLISGIAGLGFASRKKRATA